VSEELKEAIEVEEYELSADTDGETVSSDDKPPVLSPREAAIEAMAAAKSEQSQGTIVDELGNEVDESLSDEDYDNLDPEIKVPEPESPVFLNDDGKYAMKLAVNGSEVVRSLDEIVAESQKQMSADQRLQDVAEQRKQIEAREAELLQRETAVSEASLRQNNQLSSQDVGEDALDSAKALLEQIYDGNTDDAAEQLAQLIAGRQQPIQVDADAIGQQAAKDAIATIEAMNAEKAYTGSVEDGVAWLEENHPDVRQNKSLERYVDAEINVIMTKEPGITPEAAIKRATETVLEQMGQPKTEKSSRASNKAGLHREPARKSMSKKRPVPEVIDNSPSAVIAQIRKDRQMIAGRRS